MTNGWALSLVCAVLLLCTPVHARRRGVVAQLIRGFPKRVAHNHSDLVCEDITEQPDSCAFVRNACKQPSYLQYIELYYCTFTGPLKAVYFVVFGVLLAFLLLMLGTTTDAYFCDTLNALKDITGMPSNVAGVTLLALGNGAPDVFAAIAAFTSENEEQDELGLAAIIGGPTFVCSVVFGIVAMIAPGPLDRRPFVRDVVSFMGAIGLLAAFFFDGHVYLYESILLLVCYVVYVAVVLVPQFCFKKKEQKDGQGGNSDDCFAPRGETEDDGGQPVMESDLETRLLSDPEVLDSNIDAIEQAMATAEGEMGGLAATNSLAIKRALGEPQKAKKKRSSFMRVFNFIMWPFVKMRSCSIPLVEPDSWNKNHTVLCGLFGPVLFIFIVDLHAITIGIVPLWVFAMWIGTLLAMYIHFRVDVDLPKVRWPFACCGFVMSVLWIFLIAEELVDLVYAMGKILGISNAIMGLTILGVGNSLADLVADVNVAQRGEVSMAVAGIFAGPTFNVLIGLGIALTIVNARDYPDSFTFNPHLDAPVAFGLLLFIVAFSLVAVPLIKFNINKYFGVALMALWCLATTVSLMVEFDTFPDPYEP